MNSLEPQAPGSKKGISLRRAERILKVQERFDQGAKTSEIAQIYGISQRMVQKDLRAAFHLNRELVLSLDQGELLGRKIRFLEGLGRYAMRQCQLSRNENAKVGLGQAGQGGPGFADQDLPRYRSGHHGAHAGFL